MDTATKKYSPVSLITMSLIFCGAYFCIAQAEEKIKIKVDYVAKFNEISRPANYDPNNDAAPHYQKAFELCIEQPKPLSTGIKAWPKDLPDETQVLLQNWVSANSDALKELELGTQKPYYWPRYQGNSMWDMEMPWLKEARTLTRAIYSRSKLNAAKGDFEAAFSDLLVCYRFGNDFTGPKTMTEQLVGIAIRGDSVRASRQILHKTKTNPDLLRHFQIRLESASYKKNYVFDFTEGRFLTFDSIQRTFTDNSKGGGRIYGTGNETYIKQMFGEELTEEQKCNLEKLERRQTTELTDKFYDYFNSVAHKTPWQLRSEGKDLDKTAQEMTRENFIPNILTLPLGRVIGISFRCKVDTDALITILAILRYKSKKGQLPENLDQLVAAGCLRELPMDPYSDGPLVYRRIDDDFILYSLGVDFDDDGGTPSKWGEGEQGGDQVFWPVFLAGSRDKSVDHYNRGTADLKRGEYDQAISEFTKAIEISPGFAAAYGNRGLAYAKKGEYDLAISDHTKCQIFLQPWIQFVN
jgi:tetratricopeptide (TPR) repeat protein